MKPLLEILLVVAGLVTAACVQGRPPATDVPINSADEQLPGTYTHTLAVHGETRSYTVHIPPGYEPGMATPLVLSFHGGGATAAWQIERTGMNDSSDAHGFIVAYPEGTKMFLGNGRTWNAGNCCGSAQFKHVDDVAFTRAVLDDLAARYSIDNRRVFATGISNGGMLVYRLACELADRIAAIAPVAATRVLTDCRPSRPVSVIAFNGTADEYIPYNGGKGKYLTIGPFEPVADTIRFFVSANGCPGSSEVTYKNGDATCVTYAGCANDVAVTLCTIEGGGHTWPGGKPIPREGLTSADISANEAMWSFFESHPMRDD